MLRFIFLILILCSFGSIAHAQIAPQIVPAQQNSPTMETERLSQEVRAEERKMDFERTGLKYIPWNEAGKNVQDFIIQRDTNYKSLIGTGKHIDIAVYDIDKNGQPDIILFPWSHCGFQGCLYKIYYDNTNKKPEDYFGWEFVPYKQGVMLDHVYFSL